MRSLMKHVLLLGNQGAAAPFVPTDISGLVLWLDAQDATTLFQDSAKTTAVVTNDDPVGGWADKSATGITAGQATADKKPLYKASGINGLPSLLYDGSDDELNFASNAAMNFGTGSFCFCFVTKLSSQVERLYERRTALGQKQISIANPSASWSIRTADSASYLDTPPFVSDTNANILMYIRDASIGTQTTYRNGTQAATVTGTMHDISNTATGYIGRVPSSAASLDGYLGEVVVYNAAPTADQRTQLLQYFAAKWGITVP